MIAGCLLHTNTSFLIVNMVVGTTLANGVRPAEQLTNLLPKDEGTSKMRKTDFTLLMNKAQVAGAQLASYHFNRPIIQDFIGYNDSGAPLIGARICFPDPHIPPVEVFVAADAESITDKKENALTISRMWRHRQEDIRQAQRLTFRLIETLEKEFCI